MKKMTIFIMLLGMGLFIADNANALVAFTNLPIKTVAGCSNPARVIKVTNTFSFCPEAASGIAGAAITFINCSGTIYKSSSCSSLVNALGSASDTHFKMHANGGHAGYDLFVVGPQLGYYLEMDNDAMPTTDIDKKNMADFKMANSKAARTCLNKMLSTTGSKCIFNATGVSQ